MAGQAGAPCDGKPAGSGGANGADEQTIDKKVERIADHVLGQRQGLKGLLIEEVISICVAVEIGRVDLLEIGLLELLTGLEGLFKDSIRQQITHLDAYERLTAAGGGRVYVDIHAIERCVFVLKQCLALDVDRFD